VSKLVNSLVGYPAVLREWSPVVGGLIAGAIALLVGGGLAVATTVGVVNSVDESPVGTDASVVDYGSNS
jgi:hypothetical protein